MAHTRTDAPELSFIKRDPMVTEGGRDVDEARRRGIAERNGIRVGFNLRARTCRSRGADRTNAARAALWRLDTMAKVSLVPKRVAVD